MKRLTTNGLGKIVLPHWYAKLVADAVEHALSEADWQEHGTPKLSTWILGELERLAENLGGAAASPGLQERIVCSRENVTRLSSALREGLQRDGELHERRQGIGDPWFVKRTVGTLGLHFESPAPVSVPREIFAAMEAAVRGAFTRGEDVEARLLDLVERAGIPALLERLRAMSALRPSPAALLAESLPLTTVLRIDLTSDPALEASAFDALSSRGARVYRPTEKYAAGDAIEHSKLGRGLVVALDEGKVRVRFPDGERTLVHGR